MVKRIFKGPLRRQSVQRRTAVSDAWKEGGLARAAARMRVAAPEAVQLVQRAAGNRAASRYVTEASPRAFAVQRRADKKMLDKVFIHKMERFRLNEGYTHNQAFIDQVLHEMATKGAGPVAMKDYQLPPGYGPEPKPHAENTGEGGTCEQESAPGPGQRGGGPGICVPDRSDEEATDPSSGEPTVVINWGDRMIDLRPGEWPEFYAENVEPALQAVEDKARSIHGQCRHLDQTNEDYWPLSAVINGVGGTYTRRPMDLSSNLAAELRFHTTDVPIYGEQQMIHQCIDSLGAAANVVSEAERALHQYYVAIGRGGEHTITGIKITAAVAVTAATAGAGSSLTVGQSMLVAGAESAAQEGYTLALTAADPKQKISFADANAAIVNVLAKTLAAGAKGGVGKKLEGTVSSVIKSAGENLTAALVEDLIKLAGSVRSVEEFEQKAGATVAKAIGKGSIGFTGGQLGGKPGEAAAAGATKLVK